MCCFILFGYVSEHKIHQRYQRCSGAKDSVYPQIPRTLTAWIIHHVRSKTSKPWMNWRDKNCLHLHSARWASFQSTVCNGDKCWSCFGICVTASVHSTSQGIVVRGKPYSALKEPTSKQQSDSNVLDNLMTPLFGFGFSAPYCSYHGLNFHKNGFPSLTGLYRKCP